METLNILELSKKTIDELKALSNHYQIDTTDMAKQTIIYSILDKQQEVIKSK